MGVNATRSDGLTLTGVNGRAFSEYSTRQKIVSKTSSVSRHAPRMKSSLKTADQRFPDANLVWRTGCTESPPKAFLRMFGGYEASVSFVKAFPELCLHSEKFRTII